MKLSALLSIAALSVTATSAFPLVSPFRARSGVEERDVSPPPAVRHHTSPHFSQFSRDVEP